MKRTLTWCMVVMLLLATLTGCTQQTAAPAAAPAATTAPAAGGAAATTTEAAPPAAAVRDTVNLSITTALTSADAHGVRNLQDMLVRVQMYEPLYFYNASDATISPWLATSYDVSADGLTYTFHLRENVKFQNGETMKASDVVFSLLRAKEAPPWSSYTAAIEAIREVDDKTVEITIKKPNAPFMVNLAQLLIVSEKEVTEQGDKFGTIENKAGTGPYYLSFLDADVNWTLTAHPDYWRGEARIKTINYKPIADTSTGLIAFESGELDWFIAPIANWDSLVSNDKYKTEMIAANHISYVVINFEANEYLQNDDVRKAIAYAIDKEAMNIVSFEGYAEEAKYMENPAYNIAAPDSGLYYSYNPEKAKEHLKASGYPEGINVGTIRVSPGNYYEKCAQVMQSNLQDVGIVAEVELIEQASALDRLRAGDFAMSIAGYTSSGDVDSLRLRFHSGSASSLYVRLFNGGDHFPWEQMDTLFDQGAAELDVAKRKALYTQANELLMDTACLLPVFHKVQGYVWNAELNAVNGPNDYFVYDWSWNS